jgi:hypothetical protein
MRTLWCKNQENPSDRISHAWAPLIGTAYKYNNVQNHRLGVAIVRQQALEITSCFRLYILYHVEECFLLAFMLFHLYMK